jgi:hypothetical protein
MKKISLVYLSIFLFGSISPIYAQAYKMGPNTSVFFESGSGNLSLESKNKLDVLIKNAQESGVIYDVQIASWSDRMMPSNKKALKFEDKKLATLRAENVRVYLKDIHKIQKTVVYNMAEKSSWLSKKFDTEDSRLKSEIVGGDNAPMSKEEYRVFKENGRVSTVIVSTILKY